MFAWQPLVLLLFFAAGGWGLGQGLVNVDDDASDENECTLNEYIKAGRL